MSIWSSKLDNCINLTINLELRCCNYLTIYCHVPTFKVFPSHDLFYINKDKIVSIPFSRKRSNRKAAFFTCVQRNMHINLDKPQKKNEKSIKKTNKQKQCPTSLSKEKG